VTEQDCIFCAIVSGAAPSERVFEDERTVAFLDINPATDGHTLVVPKAHATDIWELSHEDAVAVMAAAVRVARAARESLACDGLNLVQANGRAGWQHVFHFHLHVVPRYDGDGLKPPWSLAHPGGDRDRIAEVADRLRSAL